MKKLFVIVVLLMQIKLNGQDSIYRSLVDIGGKVPVFELANVLNSATPTYKFQNNKKAVIIDFWATWCSPCIEAMPKLDSFARKYNDQLEHLMVTQDQKKIVSRFLKNTKIKGSGKMLRFTRTLFCRGFFRHRSLPHYVWIDKNGVLRAITGSNEITETNIKSLISGRSLALPVKTERRINRNIPLFASGQVQLDSIKSNIESYSVFTDYLQGLGTVSVWKNNFISMTNHTLANLITLAFGGFQLSYTNNRRTILEGFTQSDSLTVGFFDTKLKDRWEEDKHNFLFTYEQVAKKGTNDREMWTRMKNDVVQFVRSKGYAVSEVNRAMKVLLLERISNIDKMASKEVDSKIESSNTFITIKNDKIVYFIQGLQNYHPTILILDNTKYPGKVDIDVNADLSSLKEVSNELSKYDLKLIETDMPMNALVIQSVKNENNQTLKSPLGSKH